VRASAVLSPDGLYRYRLDRRWGPGDRAVFVLLNPSTADAEIDDATLRRCIGFARDAGMDALTVVNLYAFRATRPADLWRAPDPVGPDTDRHIEEAAEDTALVIAGWGIHGSRNPTRALDVRNLMRKDVSVLGLNKDGTPKHPLYVPKATPIRQW
jgi:hypothetical protein